MTPAKLAPGGLSSRSQEEILLEKYGEAVSYRELLRSTTHDVIKLNAHTHILGVTAEYAWVKKAYPGSEVQRQALTTLELMTKKKSRDVHFDCLTVKLADGHIKEVFFDISSFFGSGRGVLMAPDSFITGKLRQLYGDTSEYTK
jgi:hypothetical protein